MSHGIGIDPKKFKHVSSDEKMTVLKHQDGHELRIRHDILSPKLKAQLLAMVPPKDKEEPKMAEGGDVQAYSNPRLANPKDPLPTADYHDRTTPEQDKERQAQQAKDYPSKPEPKEPEPTGYTDYAEGGDVLASGSKKGVSTQGEIVRNKESRHQAKAEASGRMEMERHNKPKMKFAEGGEAEAPDAKDAVGKAINLTINTAAQPQAQPPVAEQPAPPMQQSPAQAPEAPAPNVSDAPPASLRANEEPKAEQPQEQPQKEAAQESSPTASSAAPEDQAQPEQLQEQPIQAPAPQVPPQVAHAQQTKQELDKEALAWNQDLASGHITPKTYKDLFHDKSTGGRIGMIFGMLLSGIGAGMSGQPNALMALMDKQIAQDLEAQKTSKANAQNFLRLTQAAQLNKAQIKAAESGVRMNDAQVKLTLAEANTKAYALAQTHMLQSTYHDLVNNVVKMPEGPQKEAAKQQLAIIQGQIGGKINNLNDSAAGASAYYNTLFNQAGGQGNNEEGFQKRTQGMRMLGPEGEKRADDAESKHMPGFKGSASIAIPPADREAINSGVEFDQKLNRMVDWTKKHSGSLNPIDIKAGKALAAELQGAYRQATHGGVYKEGEQNFISKIIDEDPTKFFNKVRVLPSLNAVVQENRQRINQKAKALGLPGYTPEQSSVSKIKEGQTGTYNGKPTIYTNGKWTYK